MLASLAAILGLVAIGLTMLTLAYGFSRWIGREKARPEMVIYRIVGELPAATNGAGGGTHRRSDRQSGTRTHNNAPVRTQGSEGASR